MKQTSELKEKFEKLFVHKGEDGDGPPEQWVWNIKGSFPIEVWTILEEWFSQYEADIRAKGMLEDYKEVLAFRSPYLYDDYSSLYQYTQELQKEYYEEMGKFLAKKIKELEDKND